jgi:hypothetical protein
VEYRTGEIWNVFRFPCCYHIIAFSEKIGATLDDARLLWVEFGNIPINDADQIEEPFLNFPLLADRFDIWHWFEDTFGVTIEELRKEE